MSEQKNIYTGTRFLLDVADNTQYSVFFKDGKPERLLQTYKGGVKVDAPASAKILAIDDEYQKNPKDSSQIDTMMFELKTNAQGDLRHVKWKPTSYHARIFNNILRQHKEAPAVEARVLTADHIPPSFKL